MTPAVIQYPRTGFSKYRTPEQVGHDPLARLDHLARGWHAVASLRPASDQRSESEGEDEDADEHRDWHVQQGEPVRAEVDRIAFGAVAGMCRLRVVPRTASQPSRPGDVSAFERYRVADLRGKEFAEGARPRRLRRSRLVEELARTRRPWRPPSDSAWMVRTSRSSAPHARRATMGVEVRVVDSRRAPTASSQVGRLTADLGRSVRGLERRRRPRQSLA